MYTYRDGGRVVALSGPLHGFSGSADISNLQQALTNLALKTGNPSFNPGPVNGDLNGQTLAALQASMSVIGKDLPGWLTLALQGAFTIGTGSSQVKNYIGQYATQIAMAVNTASARMSPATQTTPIIVGSVGPWYQQTWGMLAIRAGILFTGWFFFVREPAA